MLDNSAQRQKAYLCHGKGMKERRLPGQYANLVGEDYYDKRKSYDPKLLLTVPPQYEENRGRSQTANELFDTPTFNNPHDREKEVSQYCSHMMFM